MDNAYENKIKIILKVFCNSAVCGMVSVLYSDNEYFNNILYNPYTTKKEWEASRLHAYAVDLHTQYVFITIMM